MGIESLKMFLIYQKVFKVAVVSFIQAFAVSPRNSSCLGISPQRCLAHIIAKSYHFRTVIQLSRYTRENIPQGVTFKTTNFEGFCKTFFINLKFCSFAQTSLSVFGCFYPSRGKGLERQKINQNRKLFYFR